MVRVENVLTLGWLLLALNGRRYVLDVSERRLKNDENLISPSRRHPQKMAKNHIDLAQEVSAFLPVGVNESR